MASIQDPDPVRFGLYFTALTSPSIPRIDYITDIIFLLLAVISWRQGGF